MADAPVFTYQTRLGLSSEQAALFDAYAALHGRAQRSLFAALQAGLRNLNELKRDFIRQFGLTSRQFNALRTELEGKIDSIRQRRPELLEEAQTRIRKARRVVNQLSERSPGSNKLHQKKRRLALLESRLADLQRDGEAKAVRLCFGSKRLFRAQFDLQANGYARHEDWRADWQRQRSSQFFVLGSGDETAGNQTCQASITELGSLRLTLRLPGALIQPGQTKQLVIENVVFAYGQQELIAALSCSQIISAVTKAGTPTRKRIGRAISYRFVRDDKGWRVFASFEAAPVARISRLELGAIGLDTNVDHLALAQTDRFGNLIQTRRVELNLRGKSSDQTKALIGDAAVAAVEWARSTGKPLVIEALNFQQKKAELESVDPIRARIISSFACAQVARHLKAAAFRAGVAVIEVNPAYTSVIGAVNHAQRRGISVHQGAAYAIARRGLGLREAAARRTALVPVRSGAHVTLTVPARNRSKHVWAQWAKISAALKAAHAAHWRSGESKAPPAPLSPATRALGAICPSTARFRGANRSQYCLESVMEDVPW